MKRVWVVAAVALATSLGGRARAGCPNVCAASAEPVTVTPPLERDNPGDGGDVRLRAVRQRNQRLRGPARGDGVHLGQLSDRGGDGDDEVRGNRGRRPWRRQGQGRQGRPRLHVARCAHQRRRPHHRHRAERDLVRPRLRNRSRAKVARSAFGRVSCPRDRPDNRRLARSPHALALALAAPRRVEVRAREHGARIERCRRYGRPGSGQRCCA